MITLPIRLVVDHQTLNLGAQVRILDRQPQLALSSRGLGRSPLKAETGVRIPVALPPLTKFQVYIGPMVSHLRIFSRQTI